MARRNKNRRRTGNPQTAGPSHGSPLQPPESILMKIAEFLLSAESQDAATRSEAEDGLRRCEEENFGEFLLHLSSELSSDDNPLKTRILVGMKLKNTLDANDATRLYERWEKTDSLLRRQIKESLLKTLGSSISEAGDTAAQVIAKIACMEIPIDGCHDILGMLLKNMTKKGSLKKAALKTLGYLFDDIFYNDVHRDVVNSILREVTKVMDVTKTWDYIIKAECQAAVVQEAGIRKGAFKDLVTIASSYYEGLEPHIETLFEVTMNLVDEENGLEAIEFWSRICHREIKRNANSYTHSRFIEQAKHRLVPKLLETLLKEGEDGIRSEFSMAGGTCLTLVARTIGDSICMLVMPFVVERLLERDEVSRRAGAYAFGFILEGLSIEMLSMKVITVLHLLLKAMGDQNSHVKYTTVWAIGRIFEFLHSPATGFSVITPANLDRIIEALLQSIKDGPHVARNVCMAIYYFAKGYEGYKSGSSVLTLYLNDIINSLIETADTTSDLKLQSTAYKTLNEVVRCSNLAETSQIITQLFRQMVSKLKQTIELPDDTKKEDLQASLCGVLLVIIQKLSSTDETKLSITQDADKIMPLLIKVFNHGTSAVHKEAMLATGALMCASGPEFNNNYIAEFAKYLQMGLKDSKEGQVFTISVGLVSDICRALGDKMLPYCDEIMGLLLDNLSNGDDIQLLSVKPLIFTCFGDMARAIGKDFVKHIDPIMLRMKEAVVVCAQVDVKYRKQLKMSIFEVYLGILRVLKPLEGDLTLTRARQLLEFMDVVVKDDAHRDESLGKATIQLLGDLATAVGPNMSVFNLKMSRTKPKPEPIKHYSSNQKPNR